MGIYRYNASDTTATGFGSPPNTRILPANPGMTSLRGARATDYPTTPVMRTIPPNKPVAIVASSSPNAQVNSIKSKSVPFGGARPKTSSSLPTVTKPLVTKSGLTNLVVTKPAMTKPVVTAALTPTPAQDYVGPYISAYARRSKKAAPDGKTVPQLMEKPVAPTRPLASQGTEPTEPNIRPGKVTRRPIMRAAQTNLRGIRVQQLNCVDNELQEVFVQRTALHVWLPVRLTGNKEFMRLFCLYPVTKDTVMAFSKVYRLGYSRIPDCRYLAGLETFLDWLQSGNRLINYLELGQCPHKECRTYINNMDSGHYCLADGGEFTIHHLGRDFLNRHQRPK